MPIPSCTSPPSFREVLDAIGDRVGKPGLSFEAQCEDKDITGAVLREVVNHGRISKLEKFEVIIRHNGDSGFNHDFDLTLPDPNLYFDPDP